MPAFLAEAGMPYWVDLMTSDAEKSAAFYSEVLGWEVSADEADAYRMGRLQGLPVGGFIPHDSDTWVTYFLSRDLDKDLQRVESLGGKVMAPPRLVERGEMAVASDPAGGMFGLIQPPAGEHFVAGGEPGCPVWHELAVTRDFRKVVDFYAQLFSWDMQVSDEYAVAEEEGAAFAGLWNATAFAQEGEASLWQTYLGVEDIDAVAARVPELGGSVVRGPEESPFGRLCAIADPNGAVVTLAEVPKPPEEEPREGDQL